MIVSKCISPSRDILHKEKWNKYFFFIKKRNIRAHLQTFIWRKGNILLLFLCFWYFFKFYNGILFIDNKMFLTTKCDYVVVVKNSSSFLYS